MDRQETTTLLRRVRDGEAEALDRLYERVGGRLLTLIRLRLGRTLRARVDSRDVLQTVLLKSLAHFQQFEESDARSLMSWLARIADNEIRDRADHERRQRRDVRVEVPLETAHGEVAARLRSAVTQMVLDERARQIERAIESLDAGYREVILLRAFEELSFREIGARLDKSEDACRMLYVRAMAALTTRVRTDAKS